MQNGAFSLYTDNKRPNFRRNTPNPNVNLMRNRNVFGQDN